MKTIRRRHTHQCDCCETVSVQTQTLWKRFRGAFVMGRFCAKHIRLVLKNAEETETVSAKTGRLTGRVEAFIEKREGRVRRA